MIPILYIGQTMFSIRIETDLDLNDAEEMKIKYRDPSGREGEVNATVEGFFQAGVLLYELLPTGTEGELKIEQAGTWDFWPWILWKDQRVSIGDPATILVLREGMAF